MSSPCHIEMILTEKEQIVPKPEEEVAQKKKISQKKVKKQKLTAQEQMLQKINANKSKKKKKERERASFTSQGFHCTIHYMFLPGLSLFRFQ